MLKNFLSMVAILTSTKIDPLGQTKVTAGRDHCFHTGCPSVHPDFSNLAKQNNMKSNGRYWSGRVDHWWRLSCFFFFAKLCEDSNSNFLILLPHNPPYRLHPFKSVCVIWDFHGTVSCVLSNDRDIFGWANLGLNNM